MKTIGTTNEGNYLIEMNSMEFKVFNRLAEALEEKSIDQIIFRGNPQTIDFDFSGVFGAIKAFSLAKFRINEMRLLLDDLERSLKREE